MRILTVSDEECPALWDHYAPGRLDGYDLILSAGDLKADYLSFLVTMAHAPLLYVHGNHDEGYSRRPPEGWRPSKTYWPAFPFPTSEPRPCSRPFSPATAPTWSATSSRFSAAAAPRTSWP